MPVGPVRRVVPDGHPSSFRAAGPRKGKRRGSTGPGGALVRRRDHHRTRPDGGDSRTGAAGG